MSLCSLSKTPIKTPVISMVSGHVFDKEAIENHIHKYGKCPITGKNLSITDLKNINSLKYLGNLPLENDFSVPSFTEIISLITEEYASIEEEINFKRNELLSLEKDLTEYSFKQEAGRLVISRLLQEKEDLVDKVDFFVNLIEEAKTKHDRLLEKYDELAEENKLKGKYEDIELIGMHNDLVKRIKEKYSELFNNRKNRKTPSTLLPFTSLSSSLKVYKAISLETLFNNVKEGVKKQAKVRSIITKEVINDNLVVVVLENSNEISLGISSSFDKFLTWNPNNTRKFIKHVSFVDTKTLVKNDDGLLSIGLAISSYSDLSVYDISPYLEKLNFSKNDLNYKDTSFNIRILYQYKLQDCFAINCFQHPTLDYCVVTSENYFWSIHNIEEVS